MTFSSILESLPVPAQAASDEDQEIRARAVLALLIEAANQSEAVGPIAVTADKCPNCGKAVLSARSPYCSDDCRCEAAFVRQLRAAIGNGNILDRERQIFLGQAFWFVLGGGRPLRQSIAPQSALKQVFKRTDGKCEICGAPATTVDHTGSG